jgi:hypothetical protein
MILAQFHKKILLESFRNPYWVESFTVPWRLLALLTVCAESPGLPLSWISLTQKVRAPMIDWFFNFDFCY